MFQYGFFNGFVIEYFYSINARRLNIDADRTCDRTRGLSVIQLPRLPEE